MSQSLFDLDPVFPDGFLYCPDFLSPLEERELLEAICKIELHPMNFQGFLAKRKVQSFGYDYSFDSRKLQKGKPIPDGFRPTIQKVAKHLSMHEKDFAELLVTEYPVGSVINWHRDAPPFDVIVGISLMSDCVFRLRPHEKAKQGRKSILSIPVKARSLYMIKDTARTEWQHSISPVQKVRYSITLRTLKSASE